MQTGYMQWWMLKGKKSQNSWPSCSSKNSGIEKDESKFCGKKYHHKCWKGEPPAQDVLSYSTAQGCGMEAWIEIWINWDESGFKLISSWLTIQNWSTLVIPAKRELFDQEESIVWKELHIYVSFVFASWSPHYVKPFILRLALLEILISFNCSRFLVLKSCIVTAG